MPTKKIAPETKQKIVEKNEITLKKEVSKEEVPTKVEINILDELLALKNEIRLLKERPVRLETVDEKQEQFLARQREIIEAERIEGNIKVWGTFQFDEIRGGRISFPFRAFPGDPIIGYTLVDGEEYELPQCLVDHLNKNVKYKVNKNCVDDRGRPIIKTAKHVQRASFSNKDFKRSR